MYLFELPCLRSPRSKYNASTINYLLVFCCCCFRHFDLKQIVNVGIYTVQFCSENPALQVESWNKREAVCELHSTFFSSFFKDILNYYNYVYASVLLPCRCLPFPLEFLSLQALFDVHILLKPRLCVCILVWSKRLSMTSVGILL